MKVKVNGKINVGLKITGIREGLHTLDGLFHSIDLCDEFDFNYNGIEVTDETGETDIARYGKYVLSLLEKFNIGGVKIVKRIPLGGGLGGGTTALVAASTYLEKVKGKKIDDEFLLSLGSDVPFMFRGGFARVGGIGEKTEFFTPLNYFALLVKSGEVSTADAYKLLGERGKLQFEIDEIMSGLLSGNESVEIKNDLFPSAIILNDKVKKLSEELSGYGLPCFMTGSGSTVVVISKDKEKLEKISKEICTCKNNEKFFKKIVSFEKTGKSVN